MDELDQWIAHLSACKQLSEPDVKRLCDKVGRGINQSLAEMGVEDTRALYISIAHQEKDIHQQHVQTWLSYSIRDKIARLTSAPRCCFEGTSRAKQAGRLSDQSYEMAYKTAVPVLAIPIGIVTA